MKKNNNLKLLAIFLVVAAFLLIGVTYFILHKNVIYELIVALLLVAVIVMISVSTNQTINEKINFVEENIDSSLKDAMNVGNIGILVYDDEFEITYVSEFLKKRGLDHTGEKLLTWLPELERALKVGHLKEVIIINDEKYEVSKKENANTLLFKDITSEYDLVIHNQEHSYVLGLVNYDNYDEANESEEEISYINTNIKVKVVDYFKKFNIEYKTLRNNRLLLILNEKQFKELLDDRFSILTTVRSESKKADLLITLSMAFSRGSEDLVELDTLAQDLIELAQTRGGDQVVSRRIGEEAVFYGGNSEAREKQSKVKVRAIASTLKDLISKSSNVIIVGHDDSDADSIGSSIVMSKIVKTLNKEAYIVFEEDDTEAMIKEAITNYKEELSEAHSFVSINEAQVLANNDTLVIMVDHHSKEQSLAKELLGNNKRIVIIDHHRRSADLDVEPILIYVEAGASSTCELVSEFLPYLTRRNALTSLEANLAYLGILIDTNHFRSRTDARTFEVAKMLKEYGADSLLCERIAEEPYENLRLRSEIVYQAKWYKGNILIATMRDIYPRSIASQACDSLVKTKGVDAVFVLCRVSKDETIITSRSNGSINVQTIMEALDGGGHLTAAGLQRKDEDVFKLEKELINEIDRYLEGK